MSCGHETEAQAVAPLSVASSAPVHLLVSHPQLLLAVSEPCRPGMAALREQAKTSIPRVIRNSVTSLAGGQANSLEAEKEKAELEQGNAVTKALSIQECPVKEKHVRTIIIGTFKQRSSKMFWHLVSSKAPLHGNPIVCWKFLHVLHKVILLLPPPLLLSSFYYAFPILATIVGPSTIASGPVIRPHFHFSSLSPSSHFPLIFQSL